MWSGGGGNIEASTHITHSQLGTVFIVTYVEVSPLFIRDMPTLVGWWWVVLTTYTKDNNHLLGLVTIEEGIRKHDHMSV